MALPTGATQAGSVCAKFDASENFYDYFWIPVMVHAGPSQLGQELGFTVDAEVYSGAGTATYTLDFYLGSGNSHVQFILNENQALDWLGEDVPEEKPYLRNLPWGVNENLTYGIVKCTMTNSALNSGFLICVHLDQVFDSAPDSSLWFEKADGLHDADYPTSAYMVRSALCGSLTRQLYANAMAFSVPVLGVIPS